MLTISRSLQSNLQTSTSSLFSVCCRLFPQSVVSISFLNVLSPSLDFLLLLDDKHPQKLLSFSSITQSICICSMPPDSTRRPRFFL